MQVGARTLSRRLTSPPIELALVEAAVRVFRLAQPAPGANVEPSLAGIAPAAVVTFLRRRVRTSMKYLGIVFQSAVLRQCQQWHFATTLPLLTACLGLLALLNQSA